MILRPTGILINQQTGRFHPITFRPAPLPSGPDATVGERYHSLGHHTVGFDTKEQAIAWIKERSEELTLIDREYTWDGMEVPACTDFFFDVSECREEGK